MTVKQALDRILNMASGADTTYVPLRAILEEMEKRAATGDKAAAEIVQVVVRFARLIDAADKLSKEGL